LHFSLTSFAFLFNFICICKCNYSMHLLHFFCFMREFKSALFNKVYVV
jgi:hypothetical protein